MKSVRLQIAKMQAIAAPTALTVSLILSIALVFWTIIFIRDSFNRAVNESVDAEAKTQLPKIDENGLNGLGSYIKNEQKQ